MKPLDLLVVGAHPDDAEICVGGLMLAAKAAGMRVGVIDLTRGERGTRGDAAARATECDTATALLGLDHRQNMDFGDARLKASLPNREELARAIANLRPRVLIGHGEGDPHPDHRAAAKLVEEAWYLAGLEKLLGQPAHRPAQLLRFLAGGQSAGEPSLVVDITAHFTAKVELVRCYKSQLIPNGSLDEGAHFVPAADILARSEINARYWGSQIGVPFGEPLSHRGPLSADVIGLLR